MTARRIGWTIGVATLVASGAYVFVYLYRWEWNRALTAGIFFLAAEIGLAAAFVVERIRKLEHRLDRATPAPSDPAYTQVRARLVESAGAGRDHFAWMRSSAQRTNVFIPVLMGAGVILSGVAWVVERLGRATARPALESKLATRLMPITLPAGPIVADRDATPDDLALLLRPGDPGRR
jgi:hypothetical protein